MYGSFPNHTPTPTVPENLAALIDRVRAEKADLGVAWTATATPACRRKRRHLWAMALALFAGPSCKEPGRDIIRDVKCSQTLFDHVAKLGGRPI